MLGKFGIIFGIRPGRFFRSCRFREITGFWEGVMLWMMYHITGVSKGPYNGDMQEVFFAIREIFCFCAPGVTSVSSALQIRLGKKYDSRYFWCCCWSGALVFEYSFILPGGSLLSLLVVGWWRGFVNISSSSAVETTLLCYLINHMMLYQYVFPNNSYSGIFLVHENHYYISRII